MNKKNSHSITMLTESEENGISQGKMLELLIACLLNNKPNEDITRFQRQSVVDCLISILFKSTAFRAANLFFSCNISHAIKPK